ncbi:unnamed protein product [Caenorhabditis sp. 36 PRJEB53466]|nr:unnamed protein product [Caenorhabditis sp. 36 PRJEB53466]
MRDEEKKKKRASCRFSFLSTATTSSWSTAIEQLNSTYGSISQSAVAAAAAPASTSAASEPPPETPRPLSIQHKMSRHRSRYIGLKRCGHCRRFLMQFMVKKEEVYACDVCGVRVHEGCMKLLMTSCLITTQYVGGLVESAVMRSNRDKWEANPRKTTASTTSPPTPTHLQASVSTPQSPVSLNKNVNSEIMTTTSGAMSVEEGARTDLSTFLDDDLEKQMTWEDVTIRPEDVQVRGRVGEGRFGSVHYGHYHGDVALKFINMAFVEEPERRVEMFKADVVTAYKNSRHDHIALFLGYVADPSSNTYAICTNFYHHKTLYHRIHEATAEDVEVTWALSISLQICQAMSYLHKKKILHKDLRSKNILLDKPNRVVVADYALLRLERMAQPKRNYSLMVPNHWIDYLAPEIAANLFIEDDEVVQTELPFSPESDVFSFGTIFFELLTRKMPSGSMPWEQKVYEKLIGTKAALSRLDSQMQRIDTSLTLLLMRCWNFNAANRPTFASIVKSLTVLLRRKEPSGRRSTAHENPY